MTENLPITINVNKIEIHITFRIKTGYCLELLTTKTMKLLGGTNNRITEDDENVW